MSKDKNIADKIVDDSTKITITNKALKWVIGIVSGGIISILGFAWGLYVKLDAKVDSTETNIKQEMSSNQEKIMNAFKELESEEVRPNTDKNNKQDVDIAILLERTNSRGDNINGTTSRPNDEHVLPPN